LRSFIIRSGLCGASLLLLSACSQPAPAPPPTPPPAAASPAVSPVERGKYIVNTSACHDCHTPAKMGPNGPEPDMARMLSGHPENVKLDKPPALSGRWMAAGSDTFTAWAGPWGISYTANLTPDPSGLAAWTEDMFVRAIREGKHMGQSRQILPPMPWPVYRNFTDEDLKAIFAYLKSIPPVSNHVPDPIITEPPAGQK
jgi:mono/diheme cytochrome c family protein